MARVKQTPRLRPHFPLQLADRFRYVIPHPPGRSVDEAEADDVSNELQPLPPPLPGRSDDEDEDDVANELQPLPPPLPHPPGRSNDDEEEQDADGSDDEEEERDNGGADDVADEDDWDVETDEDAWDGNPEDTHVSSGRSDDDDEEEEEVEMNDEENVEIDDVDNMVREEQVHQESGNSTDSDSNFDLNDEESSSIGTSVLEFSDGDGSDIIDLSGSHDEDNAGDIVIPVGQGMSYNDPIVLE
jgi:hypothetical protein